MIRACIIGVSGYGAIHYDMLCRSHKAHKVSIVGATIINQHEEAEKCAYLRERAGCRIFDDYRVMVQELAGNADFCMIPAGIPLHKSMTIAALEAGMHVLVEKPAAGTLEDVRAMQEAQQPSNRIVAVGYQHMYAPIAMQVKQHILQGTIGSLRSIKSLAMWPRSHAYYTRNGWTGKLMVDGVVVNDSPFNNALAHELMMMLFQAGSDERVAATPTTVRASLYRANAIESPDTASLEVATKEGVPIRFYATHACRESVGPQIIIEGSRGSIVMHHNGASVISEQGKPIELSEAGVQVERQAMMSAVLDAIGGEDSFYCDLEMASRQTMAVTMAHKAATIQSVAGEDIVLKNGDTATVIPGIEDELRSAFEEERLACVRDLEEIGSAVIGGDSGKANCYREIGI